jgi:large subunit ribosomal protein L7/L12
VSGISSRAPQNQEAVENSTETDAANLVKQLEPKWGVTAIAPVAVATSSTAGAASTVDSSSTTFDVLLISSPAHNRLAVVKALRDVRIGLALSEAIALAETAPAIVLTQAGMPDAEAARKKLESAGGVVAIQISPLVPHAPLKTTRANFILESIELIRQVDPHFKKAIRDFCIAESLYADPVEGGLLSGGIDSKSDDQTSLPRRPASEE